MREIIYCQTGNRGYYGYMVLVAKSDREGQINMSLLLSGHRYNYRFEEASTQLVVQHTHSPWGVN